MIIAHNKNKAYITTHTPTPTSRVLSECDLYMPNYDKDPDMKSVKENFDRQTSQRFEEYNERIIKNRQKCKEQCDKDIQQIILKDKIEKSLEEKVEKGCLRCGCGLGGVATSVGIFGAIAVNEWTKAARAAAVQKGIDEGIKVAIKELGNIVRLNEFKLIDWAANINGTTFSNPNRLLTIVNKVNNMCTESEAAGETAFCMATKAMDEQPKVSAVQVISREAAKAAGVADKAAKSIEEAEIALANAESTYMYSAIGYSVLGILIILLAMLIIYLILRYRRKKKMNKKIQYTKLLNQ
ncbi:rifin [Plasmodium falciparum RAJ116]|uniref:Rifin n=1 Tax=Plasmodium falciparum RAJ116 TaxID=580058 RepID=A0A0L0CUH0_PLAFA|nr:rifin [Plasmodium falciparum RAJ116]